MIENDPFEDREDISDFLYCVLDKAVTDEERYFVNVVLFHRDFLNGGFDQALANHRGNINNIIVSYEKLNLEPLKVIISAASSPSTNGFNLFRKSKNHSSRFDSVYVAMTYNLAYSCGGNQFDHELASESDGSDWVERLALKYARKNRNSFKNLMAAYVSDVEGSEEFLS